MIIRRSAALSSAVVMGFALAACNDGRPSADDRTTTTTATTTTETSSSTAVSATPSITTTESPTPVDDPVEPELPAPEEPEVPAPDQPESIWAPPDQGYQCPQTDAYVWDAANCTPENLGAGPAPDLSSIPVWQGGECSYAECGYPPGEPAPGTMQAEVAEGCRSGELTGPGCDQYL